MCTTYKRISSILWVIFCCRRAHQCNLRNHAISVQCWYLWREDNITTRTNEQQQQEKNYMPKNILEGERFWGEAFRLQNKICCLLLPSCYRQQQTTYISLTHFSRTFVVILEFFHQLAPFLLPPRHFYLSSSSITMRCT